MHQFLNKLLPVALLAITAPAAMAQSSGDVAIGGTLVPGSCTLTLVNGGVLDLGQIPTSTLPESGYSANMDRTMSASVGCSGATRVMFTISDNRIATLPDPSQKFRMGLGLTSTGKPIGYYNVWWSSATRDGFAATVIYSDNGTSWSNDFSTQWGKSNIASPSIPYRAIGNGTFADGPIALNTATFEMTVRTKLLGRNDLQLTSDASIDGSSTIEIVYL